MIGRRDGAIIHRRSGGASPIGCSYQRRPRPYLGRSRKRFGEDIDYAMLDKIYGEAPEPAGRYSPAVCIGAKKQP